MFSSSSSTQFWDTYTGLESSGQVLPKNSWTLHGLWPDFCNGSFTQYCDLSRQYDPSPSPNTTTGPNGTTVSVPAYTGPGVDTFVQDFGRYDLLAYMKKYWVSQGSPSAGFWAHEFSKHATCYSTFDVPCYGPKYEQHEEVIDFFETAITYFRQLPTYDWLADAGIVPSNTTSYSLHDIQNALRIRFGATPYLGCSGPKYSAPNSTDHGKTVLSEAWYYHNVSCLPKQSFADQKQVLGRPQDGKSVVLDASVAGSVSSCSNATGAIWYYERGAGSQA